MTSLLIRLSVIAYFLLFFAFWTKVEIERENCAAGDVQACEWIAK